MRQRIGDPACATVGAGMPIVMGIVNRIVAAILTIVTAPFRALGALFGRRGAGRRPRR